MKATYDKLCDDCSKLTTKRYSTSFSLGIYFLGKSIRTPIYNIYGFVRLADEIVDTFHEYDKKYLLHKFKVDTYEAIAQGISLNPILNAFQKVVNEYQIDAALIDLFLDSMEMDLEEVNYDESNYEKYILGSAQVVGLMCLKVFAKGDEETYQRLKPSAMKLGSAFQKVNFLRDVKADYQLLNRSYFPNVDLSRFTITEKRLIETDIENEFNEALQGIKQLPIEAKRGVYLAYIYYKELFNKIKRLSAERVMNERIRISNTYKLRLMCDSMIRYKMNTL